MEGIDPNIFADLVPAELGQRSGAVFYSGRAAFSRRSRVYILGLNPGGSPIAQANETIRRAVGAWRNGPERWSAYLDHSWRGAPPGTYGIQPRMLHMLAALGLDPREVPASNVVFLRSIDEAALAAEKGALLEQCWPVHGAVIGALGVSTVLCLGGTAGRWVRGLLGAEQLVGRFTERNSRGWANEAHVGANGVCVVTLTHPGRADWRNPAADPTPLVREMLDR